MIYIYNCYGGTHSSVIAAEYHLGNLPENEIPAKETFLKLPYFNQLNYSDMGNLFYHGKDDNGNLVYTIGRGRSKHLVPALTNFTAVLHKEGLLREKVIISITSPTVPPLLTLGGFFARGLHINFIGVPLLCIGARQAYPTIQALVRHTKKVSYTAGNDVMFLDNKKFKTT